MNSIRYSVPVAWIGRRVEVRETRDKLEIELDAADKEAARKSLDEAAHKFLSNPVIEDYRLEIE